MTLWVVGIGDMGKAYLDALRALEIEPIFVGRAESKARSFASAHGARVYPNGVDAALRAYGPPSAAIVASSLESLVPVTEALIAAGTKRLLIEKPGALCQTDARAVSALAARHDAMLYIAYNRRFYASVASARRLIAEDGGVLSFHFEFTEAVDRILGHGLPHSTLANWFIANSTHVVDLAFHLGGEPAQLSATAGGSLDWHPNGIFVGHGVTKTGAYFTFNANWHSAGRWRLEICTRQRKLYFNPIEKLQAMERGSFEIHPIQIDDEDDLKFKPGILRQCNAFINGVGAEALTTFAQQVERFRQYDVMRYGSPRTT